MKIENIDEILKKQRTLFKSGATLPIPFRIKMLRILYSTIKKYESEIKNALHSDLGKSDYESFMCEIGIVLSEITYMIKHIHKFAKAKKVHTPLSQFSSKSYKLPSPYGTVLIMSPWNYPFLLTLEPLVDAISAGNTAIVKPSAYSPKTSLIIEKIISECYRDDFVSVITGGRKENSTLLDKKFDLIFFTGSQNVGKEVLRHAAEYLTPTVLELGGKSPCIVDKTAKIKLAAKRIVFGKFLNCGQTCVAPDYILCDKTIKDELIKEIIYQTKIQFGDNPLNNSNYGKIINEKHFNRIRNLIIPEKIIFGGKFDDESLKIEPTILDNVTWNDSIMQEEIFGPILPILTFEDFNEIYSILEDKPKPLALYLFSKSKNNIKNITTRCSYGGGCINDTIIHLATSEMGFGGVGESGMGSYHGKAGFDAFSHTKSIVDKKTWIDLPMRYQPYNKKLYEKIIRMFLR